MSLRVLVPLASLAFAYACSEDDPLIQEIPPDRPKDFPEQLDNDVGVPPDVDVPEDVGEECVPASCDGILIDRFERDGQKLCMKFSEVAAARGLISPFFHNAVKVFDFNEDGLNDVLLLNDNSKNELFRNTGNGFVNVAEEQELDLGEGGVDAVFGGENSDDLAITGQNGTQVFIYNNGFFSPGPLLDGEPGTAIAWIGVGYLVGSENGIIQLGGDWEVIDYSQASAIAVSPSLDRIYLANEVGENRLFRRNDDGTYSTRENQEDNPDEKLNLTGASTDAQWVQLNDGELPTLVVTNYGSANYVFEFDQNGELVPYEEDESLARDLSLQDPGNTMALAWSRDMVFMARWQQENLLHLAVRDTNGVLQRYEQLGGPLKVNSTGETMDAEVFDYNNDEKLDLIVVMFDGGLKLYENESEWVKVCDDAISNSI